MANIYDMVDTWNAGATTFTAIKMNVTDTASAAGSSLLDLQVGGVSRFAVGKTGGVGILTAPSSSYPLNVNGSVFFGGGVLDLGASGHRVSYNSANLAISNGTTGTVALQTAGLARLTIDNSGLTTLGGGGSSIPQLTFTPNSGVACSLGMANSGSQLGFYAGPTSSMSFSGSNLNLASNVLLSWTNGINNPFTTTDLFLARDAANALAQRNGVNPQAFRVYNTFTDGSNYERGVFDWSTTANVLIIGTQQGGTGAARTLRLLTQGDANLQFFTNGTQRFDISSIGLRATANLIWTTDNTFDIGASGANRPRNVFVAGSITAGPAISTANDAGVVTWGASNDVILTRDAASVLAQRNSTNPQAFRVYNTFTDGSNYERGVASWSANVIEFGAENAGTGASRNVRIKSNVASVFIATSNTDRWNFNSNGHFLAVTDNTYDIGATGGLRPRNIFAAGYMSSAGSVYIGGSIEIIGAAAGVGVIRQFAVSDFNRLTLGGTSNAFPSIKRSGTDIDFRLADDSAFTGIGAASVSVAASTTARPHFALTAGVAPTSPANGDIWFDGTDMKIRIGGVTKTFTII